MKYAKSIEEYFEMNKERKAELQFLRDIMLSADMEETLKWGAPTYTVNNKNVVGLGAFKSYVGIWFHQGALLKDPQGVLINAQEGVTKALRQWRFTTLNEIKEHAALIKAYVEEAVANQKAGKEITMQRKKKLEIPEELQAVLKVDPTLNAQFYKFSPGRQREFTEYIAEAKRESTKLSRLEKIKPMILAGIGLNDKYRK